MVLAQQVFEMLVNIEDIHISGDELERYSKQILIKNIGGNGQRKLKSSKVLVIGLGGLGSPVVTHLSSSGIGKIGLVDNDTVELSNLQRQFIHNVDRIGLKKTESAKIFMGKLNPNSIIYDYETDANSPEFIKIIAEYDIVIDCTDNFKTRFKIADACQKYKKPYILGTVRSYEGQVTTILPSTKKNKNPEIRSLFDEENVSNIQDECSDNGVLSTTTTLVGTIMASECLKIILNISEGLVGKLLMLDLLNMKFETIEYK